MIPCAELGGRSLGSAVRIRDGPPTDTDGVSPLRGLGSNLHSTSGHFSSDVPANIDMSCCSRGRGLPHCKVCLGIRYRAAGGQCDSYELEGGIVLPTELIGLASRESQADRLDVGELVFVTRVYAVWNQVAHIGWDIKCAPGKLTALSSSVRILERSMLCTAHDRG